MMKKQTSLKTFELKNFRQIPQINRYLSEEQKLAIEVVGNVLPFRSNSYVIEELIDWTNVPNDPFFILTFPQKDMLFPHHYKQISDLIERGASEIQIKDTARKIRMELNPYPAGQEKNVPVFNGSQLYGIQHKYKETVLFFPTQGQNCSAYCTFCFRWSQFSGDTLRFAMQEVELLIQYLTQHPEVTDILFTGGDPLTMSATHLNYYVEALLNANLPNLQTIRFGSKTLTYNPYRYTNNYDADDILRIFEKIVAANKTVSFMAHFNHVNELKTEAVHQAIRRIRNTGAVIRTQSPLLKHINSSSCIWRDMWKEQVRQGLVPYYMFVVRDTGAQHYFAIPLVKAWEIYKEAYKEVSGVVRTVRGPSMSSDPGKIQITGITEIQDEKVIGLNFIQGRNPDWVQRPFFAKYNADAIWLDQLEPAFEKEKFFFEE